MQLADLIEKSRFVGREFLLLLWLDSELFDGTLSTREHGSFGLWIEKKLVLSAHDESTNVKAPLPGLGRQAKEALLRGQLPESAGIRVSFAENETSFVLAGENFAMRGLKLQTELGHESDAMRAISSTKWRVAPAVDRRRRHTPKMRKKETNFASTSA